MLNVITNIIQEKLISKEDLAAIKAFYDSFINGNISDDDIVGSEILAKIHDIVTISYFYIIPNSKTMGAIYSLY